MSAGEWVFFNAYRVLELDGTADLDADELRITLHSSDFNPNVTTMADYADLTDELPTANGYTEGGEVVTGVVISQSGADAKLVHDDVLWIASGSPLVFRYLVMRDATLPDEPLIAYALANDAPGDVTVPVGKTVRIRSGSSGAMRLT